jgi:nitrogen fixation NifU-like protein
VVLWLRVEDEVIAAAAYKTFGCPAAIASASVLAELVEGSAVADALAIDEVTLMRVLDGLPEGKDHCPRLAIEALGRALAVSSGRALAV